MEVKVNSYLLQYCKRNITLPSLKIEDSSIMECANPRTRIAIPWSDLPPELLQNISKRLPSQIETLRFRAVCHSWRSSTPPYKFPTINLPFPFDAAKSRPRHSGAYFTLTERVVYRIQLPRGKSSDFWIVKLEHAADGKVRVINPVTHRRVEIPPAVEMPKVLNLLDFDVSEVCKGYALRYVNPSTESDDYYDFRRANKVAFSSNIENGVYVVMAIDSDCRLWYIISGDEKWTSCDPRSNNLFPGAFYDVASINGELRVADANGIIWGFDSEFRCRRIGRYKGGLSLKRRLVELCNGELVLVQEMREAPEGPLSRVFPVKERFVDIRVYAQTKVLKKWMDVRAMEGCILVVGDDCSFSVPTTEKLKAARVFYTDRYSFHVPDFPAAYRYDCFECDCREGSCYCLNGLETEAGDDEVANGEVKRLFEGCHGENIGVYDCRTGKTGTALMYPEYASIFWPPPSWLSRE